MLGLARALPTVPALAEGTRWSLGDCTCVQVFRVHVDALPLIFKDVVWLSHNCIGKEKSRRQLLIYKVPKVRLCRM